MFTSALQPLFRPLKQKNRLADTCNAVFSVPRTGLEPVQTLRSKGFSYHYGFCHQDRLTVPVRGLDYSFTIGQYPVGVSCLVSAPSSNQRLGSRLPSASTVKASLNLRHSTSSLSGCALNLALPRRARISPSCLPFHHQGLPGVRRADA